MMKQEFTQRPTAPVEYAHLSRIHTNTLKRLATAEQLIGQLEIKVALSERQLKEWRAKWKAIPWYKRFWRK